MTRPYSERIRCQNSLSLFDYFEIQTTREFQPSGNNENCRYTEVVTEEEDCDDDHEEAVGPVMFSVYGHYATDRSKQRGVRCIADFETLEIAQQFVMELNGEPSNVPEQERSSYIQHAIDDYVKPTDHDIEIYDTADVRKNDDGGVWVEAYVYLYPEEQEDEE